MPPFPLSLSFSLSPSPFDLLDTLPTADASATSTTNRASTGKDNSFAGI